MSWIFLAYVFFKTLFKINLIQEVHLSYITEGGDCNASRIVGPCVKGRCCDDGLKPQENKGNMKVDAEHISVAGRGGRQASREDSGKYIEGGKNLRKFGACNL